MTMTVAVLLVALVWSYGDAVTEKPGKVCRNVISVTPVPNETTRWSHGQPLHLFCKVRTQYPVSKFSWKRSTGFLAQHTQWHYKRSYFTYLENISLLDPATITCTAEVVLNSTICTANATFLVQLRKRGARASFNGETTDHRFLTARTPVIVRRGVNTSLNCCAPSAKKDNITWFGPDGQIIPPEESFHSNGGGCTGINMTPLAQPGVYSCRVARIARNGSPKVQLLKGLVVEPHLLCKDFVYKYEFTPAELKDTLKTIQKLSFGYTILLMHARHKVARKGNLSHLASGSFYTLQVRQKDLRGLGQWICSVDFKIVAHKDPTCDLGLYRVDHETVYYLIRRFSFSCAYPVGVAMNERYYLKRDAPGSKSYSCVADSFVATRSGYGGGCHTALRVMVLTPRIGITATLKNDDLSVSWKSFSGVPYMNLVYYRLVVCGTKNTRTEPHPTDCSFFDLSTPKFVAITQLTGVTFTGVPLNHTYFGNVFFCTTNLCEYGAGFALSTAAASPNTRL